ncbi:ribonuclease P protein component [Candidatus Desantisbacteria bacterium]|nr:ribonuclease P protein component [Candidatus Desantisbacteria bacterium]
MNLGSIDYGLPKTQRLLQLSEFNAVYSRGIAYHHRFFVLFVLKVAPSPETTLGQTQGSAPTRRVGIVAGKKVGGAVRRNRAKRLLREAYRLNKNKFIQGLDIVLVAKRMLPDLTFHEVEKNLLYIFKKANILNTEHR